MRELRQRANVSDRLRLALLAAGALVVTAALTGCGFHLQGRTQLPARLAAIHIVADDEQTDFYHALRASLLDANVQLLDHAAAQNPVELRINVDTATTRVLTVSARNVPTEYELTYAVTYTVHVGDQQPIDEEKLSLTRDYSYQESQALAKEREEGILREAIARDLASVVMRRLSSL